MNKEISAPEAVILRNNNKDTVFLDVREHSELAICRIEGALHIPMGEVPERHKALPRDAPLVVLCHHGMRSLNVVQYLETKSFQNAINLAGGIHAWAVDVDPEMKQY
jgi:rhodanese-related sulfurtransferase|tara:strand:- start:1392 stop:1712 length:321 start_codon:yes stop_codon:yes gene_type:complete